MRTLRIFLSSSFFPCWGYRYPFRSWILWWSAILPWSVISRACVFRFRIYIRWHFAPRSPATPAGSLPHGSFQGVPVLARTAGSHESCRIPGYSCSGIFYLPGCAQDNGQSACATSQQPVQTQMPLLHCRLNIPVSKMHLSGHVGSHVPVDGKHHWNSLIAMHIL